MHDLRAVFVMDGNIRPHVHLFPPLLEVGVASHLHRVAFWLLSLKPKVERVLVGSSLALAGYDGCSFLRFVRMMCFDGCRRGSFSTHTSQIAFMHIGLYWHWNCRWGVFSAPAGFAPERH